MEMQSNLPAVKQIEWCRLPALATQPHSQALSLPAAFFRFIRQIFHLEAPEVGTIKLACGSIMVQWVHCLPESFLM